ncbi:MAG: 16S rRNA (cytidine(1402)-2'-O)-methyltransferase [Rickettsiales bacterium]|nr:MAG: 16S rRNA (cytidine(1402)-2'-O)-methyltransferase [Rickettsiales bacterium]
MGLIAGLYIVSTPIGNLGDISLRALETLKSSDVILCEDTRVSGKLLAKHGIKASLKVYNDNSDNSLRRTIKGYIAKGMAVSLISDAGTPLISDPGYKLVRELKADGHHIDAIPGACAAITALTLSGIATDRFLFAGFLPKTKEKKKKAFEEFADLNATIVFYETANRIVSSLEVAIEVFGDREANIGRELTKLYQESRSEKLSVLLEYYKNNPPKGEIVFTISPKSEDELSIDDIKDELSAKLSRGESARTASDEVFSKYKGRISRKEVYKLANQLKNEVK